MGRNTHGSRVGYSGLSSSGAARIEVRDEGASIGTFHVLNFIGGSVEAKSAGSIANIYIPPETYDSHWNTSDGDNGNQAVTESISRTTSRISTPNGGEGVPFKTGGWAGTNASTTTSASVTIASPGDCTGFGGTSSAVITVYDADGTTVLETYTTPSLNADAVHTSPSGSIVATISSFGADGSRFKANLSVGVSAGVVLSSAGLSGGRYHISVVMNTDPNSDGTGPYTYTQSDVFYDTNPTTPSCDSPTMAETAGQVVTKHLSGVEYYTTGSQFTVSAGNIDQLNRNTEKTSDNLALSATHYGLVSLSQSPFGSGAAQFAGWTNDDDVDNVTYLKTDWAISQPSFRYTGTAGQASATPKDPWASGTTQSSANSSILVDTYSASSTDTFEGFDDEAKRQDSGYNNGSPTGNWTSANDLVAGEAMVYMGQLIVPNQARLSDNSLVTDWGTFAPNAVSQPDYTGLGANVSYYRTIVDAAGTDRSSMTITFAGTFISNATTDLANENLKIYVRRRASGGGGGSGVGSDPLRLHGADYNFATFDDGATVGGSYIREASSSGNTVNATFGGFPCIDGLYIQVEIANAGIKIDSFDVTFF